MKTLATTKDEDMSQEDADRIDALMIDEIVNLALGEGWTQEYVMAEAESQGITIQDYIRSAAVEAFDGDDVDEAYRLTCDAVGVPR